VTTLTGPVPAHPSCSLGRCEGHASAQHCRCHQHAVVSPHESEALAVDDEQERRVRLLLLGEGAVLAQWFERPLAAELDESQQRSG
jgi:hypothetical protein